MVVAFLAACFLLFFDELMIVSASVIASDKRVKVNVAQADTESFYSQIQKVQLHKYDYVSDHFRRNRRFNGTQVGFIAQELKEIIPERYTFDLHLSIPSLSKYPHACSHPQNKCSDRSDIEITQRCLRHGRN